MKKWLIVIIICLLAAVTFVYAFTSGTIVVVDKITLKGPVNAARRTIITDTAWDKWWPGKKQGDNSYQTGDYTFKTTNRLFQGVEIAARGNELKDSGIMLVTPIKADSFEISWQSKISIGNNPFKRVAVYNDVKTYRRERERIIENLRNFLENPVNIYGVAITQQKVTDTFLISTYQNFDHYPSTADIYELINKLKTYMALKNANAANYPMMHIDKNADAGFLARVAIPIDKKISSSGNIEFKIMIKGNILVTGDIKGGNSTVARAMDGVNNYIKDYEKTSPAIPFESLVTDRVQEPDSSKWITRIYYPVL